MLGQGVTGKGTKGGTVLSNNICGIHSVSGRGVGVFILGVLQNKTPFVGREEEEEGVMMKLRLGSCRIRPV